MNTFQPCQQLSDAIPLYLPQQLYLKPIARLRISIQLPQKTLGKNISNWEVMETLRSMIKPDMFSLLKVTKTNLDIICLEAETDDKSRLDKVISKLDNKMMKLREFPDLSRIRACEAKLDFPTRHTWDTFFREAKNMNELKPGERPDTIHISNLPIKWFVPYHLSGEEDLKPSEKIFFRIFEKFGHIRNVDIPICDPYRNKMKNEVSGMQVFDYNEKHYFEGYVQFKDYIGFTKTMDALRGMKLLHKLDGEAYTVKIVVDFDRTKHLSDAYIRRREIVRDKLIQKEIAKEEQECQQKEEEQKKMLLERQKAIDEKKEKERRRHAREEKRKAKILAKLKLKEADEINEKIAKEEKKLLKVQRKLEAIRLVEVLFKRIKIRKENDVKAQFDKTDNEDELTKLKSVSELEVRQQREKVNQVIEGRVVLKSILASESKSYRDSSGSESSSTRHKKKRKDAADSNIHPADALLNSEDWYGYSHLNNLYPYHIPPVHQPMKSYPSNYFPYFSGRGRSRGRGFKMGSSRGIPFTNSRRSRGIHYRRSYHSAKPLYPPELQREYYRYFEKFLQEKNESLRSSCSRSRSKSARRYSKSRSRQRSWSRSPSYSRHSTKNRRSRVNVRSRSKSYSKSRSYTRKRRSYSNSRRSSSRNRSSYSSPKNNKTRRSKHKKKNSKKSRSRSLCKKSAEKELSKSPSYRSIDSSQFISPSRLRMPRSRSWSFPRGINKKTNRSSSKSRTPEKKN